MMMIGKKINKWFTTFLSWSSCHIKTDMRYLVHGGAWLVFEQAVFILASLALGVGLGNLISPDTYGVYKYIISTVVIIGAFSLAGFPSAIVQATARNFDGALKAAVAKFLSWSIVPMLIGMGISIYYFVQGNQVFGLAFLIATFLSPFSKAFSFYEATLIGKKLFGIKAVITTVREVGFVSSLIAVAWYTHDVLYIVITFFVYQIIATLLGYMYTKAKYIRNQAVDDDFSYFGYKLSGLTFIQTMAQQFDKLFVFQLLGPTQLALYAFAILPIEKLDSFRSVLISLAIPRFSNRPIADIQTQLFHKFLIVLAVCIVIVTVYILLAPYLFTLILPQYTEAIAYSQVLALALLAIPSALAGAMLSAHRQTRFLYIINICEQFTRISLGVVLILLFGIWGAVIAYLASVIVRVTIATYFAFTVTLDPLSS